jgi:hypothetical protein
LRVGGGTKISNDAVPEVKIFAVSDTVTATPVPPALGFRTTAGVVALGIVPILAVIFVASVITAGFAPAGSADVEPVQSTCNRGI